MKILLKALFSTVLVVLVIGFNFALAEVKFLDLSNYANHNTQNTAKTYANLPREQILYSIGNNTPFIIHQGVNNNIFLVTSGASVPDMPYLPDVINIPVNDFASKIHFFGHIHFGPPGNSRFIGKYTLNFEGASSIDIFLDSEQTSPQWNIDDHCCNWRSKNLTKASLAWEDTTQTEKRALLREFVFENPAPNKKIVSIDFTSFNTSVNPVLAAITYYTPEISTPTATTNSCEIPTIKSNLDIHIPNAKYQTLLGSLNLWVDMEYAGHNTGGDYWRLKNYAQINQNTDVIKNVCSNVVKAGADTPETVKVELGQTSGTITFEYETYTIKDRMTVTYGTSTLFDSGCVGTKGLKKTTIPYAGTSSEILVQVEPNCAGSSDTEWQFKVSCPATSH